MASSIPRRFCKPEMLRKIGTRYLVEFLTPYASYLSGRNLDLPVINSHDDYKIDYDLLSDILLDPNSETPSELSEALFYVNELSSNDAFDILQEAIKGTELDAKISSRASACDLAIQIWMTNRELIERIHAEQYITNIRSFRYFKTEKDPVPEFTTPSRQTIHAIEDDLNDWFNSKRRGRSAKISMLPKGTYVWFLVRHGEPFTRESVIEDGKSAPLFFQPEKTDVVIYNTFLGEVRIHAKSKGAIDKYREVFGLHLFDDKEFFTDESKFTLEPLITDREQSLLCGDVPEILDIKLVEISIFRGGAHGMTEVRKADDLFAAIQDGGYDFIPSRNSITKASFKVLFKGAKSPRTISINSGNRAQFKRDDDAEHLEKWLGLRGFIRARVTEVVGA
ncbi:MAG: hypothetical protein GX556_14390 [Fibrobacter sp.]|nr:hypothetical protein [Fibrobacter sp.]